MAFAISTSASPTIGASFSHHHRGVSLTSTLTLLCVQAEPPLYSPCSLMDGAYRSRAIVAPGQGSKLGNPFLIPKEQRAQICGREEQKGESRKVLHLSSHFPSSLASPSSSSSPLSSAPHPDDALLGAPNLSYSWAVADYGSATVVDYGGDSMEAEEGECVSKE